MVEGVVALLPSGFHFFFQSQIADGSGPKISYGVAVLAHCDKIWS
jgi:hypothetical protein